MFKEEEKKSTTRESGHFTFTINDCESAKAYTYLKEWHDMVDKRTKQMFGGDLK